MAYGGAAVAIMINSLLLAGVAKRWTGWRPMLQFAVLYWPISVSFIMLAGVTMNALLAYGIYAGLLLHSGLPTPIPVAALVTPPSDLMMRSGACTPSASRASRSAPT